MRDEQDTPANRLGQTLDENWPLASADPTKRRIILDGKAIGKIDLSGSAPDLVWIRHLSLDPGLEGRGLGGRAMRLLTGWADAAGCSMWLEAFSRPDLEDGGPLPRFYRRLGFCETGGADEDSRIEMSRAAAPAQNKQRVCEMKREAREFSFGFSWGPAGTPRAEQEDYLASFTVTPGRPAGRVSPAEPESIEIGDLFIFVGTDPVAVGDDTGDQIRDWLMANMEREMLRSASEDLEVSLSDREEDRTVTPAL